MLDVYVESFAFKEDFEVAVVLKDRVRGGLLEHSFQGGAAGFHEVAVEAADGLLVWRWRDYDARVTIVEGVVQPEEVTVSPADGEFGLSVCF